MPGLRPRLLFLCQTLPYPLDSGVAIRSYHTLRILSRVFDVTALCFYRRKGGLVSDGPGSSLARLRSLARVEAFPVPQEHNVSRLLWDHLRSLARGRVYAAFAYQSRPFAQRVGELLRTSHFDLVHLDSIVLSGYGGAAQGAPVVCMHHNVESVLLQRRADVMGGGRRAYLTHQARLMEREERRCCGRWALNVLVSEADHARLRAIAPEASCAVIPNGVDTSHFAPARGRDEGLVFVGEATWFPNRDALRYFCDAILPRVRADGRKVRVQWVGRAPQRIRSAYQRRYDVELTGFVADIRPAVRDAACYVVPLRVGGGTRVKILDAWAMGKAVVSTSVGCEGLAAEDGRNILIRDDPDGFAQAVRAVLSDAGMRQRLGAEGRRTVERLYSWDRIGESLLNVYLSVLESSHGPLRLLARAAG